MSWVYLVIREMMCGGVTYIVQESRSELCPWIGREAHQMWSERKNMSLAAVSTMNQVKSIKYSKQG